MEEHQLREDTFDRLLFWISLQVLQGVCFHYCESLFLIVMLYDEGKTLLYKEIMRMERIDSLECIDSLKRIDPLERIDTFLIKVITACTLMLIKSV